MCNCGYALFYDIIYILWEIKNNTMEEGEYMRRFVK